MSALDVQVGGKHYKTLKIQPIQITYQIGASPLWCKVCKYITRIKEDKTEDIEKAIHCIELEEEMLDLRCSKYIVEMVPYEHKDIKDFSEQFEESKMIYSVLSDMYFGYYERAKQTLKEIING